MTTIKTSHRARWSSILGAILCLLIFAMPVLAGGGNVLPPTAEPKGYSLVEAAAATASFNAGPRTQEPADFPFQILYLVGDPPNTTFTVKPGTLFYVPIVWSDNSAPILGNFPDVNNPQAVSDYYFNQAELGAEYITITVDGIETNLGPSYVAGAETELLPTGGDKYTVAAAFLTPLSKGTHSVRIAARFTGDALDPYPEYFPGGVWEFNVTYTVKVK